MNRITFKAAKYARHRDHGNYNGKKPKDGNDAFLWLLIGIILFIALITK